jgi:hypothetical protein
MFPRITFSILFLAILVSTAIASDAPAWMKQAMTASIPSYEKDVPAVVLRDEEQVTVGDDGKIVTTQNYAIKMLTREGRGMAIARGLYLVSSGKVRDIEAWLIRPDGTTKTYDKKSVLDIISDPDDVYNEYRIKVIDASVDSDTGAVFGYTIVSEESALFYQDSWKFQSRLPTVFSRYSLTLPAGWKASSTTFNAVEVKPQVNGNIYTWELRNLPPIPPEPMSPAIVNMAPRVAINYGPSDPAQTANKAFSSWTDVSKWATALHDPQIIVDDNVAAKARELTANASSEIEKIRAIGNFVQNLQYISIDIGVGYGNGYRPRASTTVLGRGYGDCKDKANLMRALLRALKIEAYPVAIFSGDPNYVREEWASPLQFNHCIIAIKVSDATKANTIIDHPTLGRLMIFDATDPYTPVGDLPDYLQGSWALIIAGSGGGLAKMPLSPPESDELDRDITVSLSETGEITGKIIERAKGQTSSQFRREVRGQSAGDYKKTIEGWLTRGASGAQLINVQSSDKGVDSFDLDVDFKAANYGQLMQNRLLVFKPVIVGRRHSVYLTESKRTNPIELDSNMMNEKVIFNLPPGFSVDEVPDAVKLDTAFGKYVTSYEVKDGKLLFTRSMTTNRALIPANKYTLVKDFFSKIRDAEQAPVVLIRK